jgi:MYXO-CTERM domain-containing protein
MRSTLPLKLNLSCAVLAAAAFGVSKAEAAGVTVNNSALIGAYDYADAFTGTADGGAANRPYIAAVQPAPAYVVNQTFGHPTTNFQTPGQAVGVASFSIASDTQGQVAGSSIYPGSSGAGSSTGFTQTGGGADWVVSYGFRTNYIVQVDAVTVHDRIDISSGPNSSAVGGSATNSLAIFFRGDGTGAVSLYNSVDGDTPVPGYNTGITAAMAGQWNNYAVRFDTVNNKLELYVNQVSKGIIDLLTVGGGKYANFSNAFVGVGGGMGAGDDRLWTDNFQVGAPIPEPGSMALALGSLGLLTLRRRR